jgi:hypothetical protein
VELHALLAEPLPAVLDDAGEVGEGFDVVDDGGLAEEALDGGEGGLDAGPAALALEAFEQCGFLAADVGACAAVDVAVDFDAPGDGCAVERPLPPKMPWS